MNDMGNKMEHKSLMTDSNESLPHLSVKDCFHKYKKKCSRLIKRQKYIKSEKSKIYQDDSILNKKKTYTKWKKAYYRYGISHQEYVEYGFDELSNQAKSEFISVHEMRRIYFYNIAPEVREIFRNKVKFLEKFERYIHRDWCYIGGETDSEKIQRLLQKDCIIKPLDLDCGRGIEKIVAGTIVDEAFLKKYDGYLLEECVYADAAISDFHPFSLNTIRVVTFNLKKGIVVFGAFLRIGNNYSCVDNAHHGGIFAQINVDTGIIESDGISVTGEHYEVHPISKKKIKGFRIPKWNEIKDLCIEAGSVVGEAKFIGWDVILRDTGEIEIIEGNDAPDFDVMQSPLKVGVKKKVYTLLKEMDVIMPE